MTDGPEEKPGPWGHPGLWAGTVQINKARIPPRDEAVCGHFHDEKFPRQRSSTKNLCCFFFEDLGQSCLSTQLHGKARFHGDAAAKMLFPRQTSNDTQRSKGKAIKGGLEDGGFMN